MRTVLALLLALGSVIPVATCRRPGAAADERRLYTIGIFQSVDSATSREVVRGLLQAFRDSGWRDGDDVRLIVRNARGDIPEVHRTAQRLIDGGADMLIPVSTASLQAALIAAAPPLPIVFTSVANPYLLGAGRTARDHLAHVTGFASTGPIRETVRFIRDLLPQTKRIGTLWTPSELNSEYYLEIARETAAEVGLELVAVPVTGTADLFHAAQLLLNERIEAFYPISDNTINTAFETLGRIAEENAIPLIGSFLPAAELGACAALGIDQYEMGYQTGLVAVRVRSGESPGDIPFQTMDNPRLHLNLFAARRQGLSFPAAILREADKVIDLPPSFRASGEPAAGR